MSAPLEHPTLAARRLAAACRFFFGEETMKGALEAEGFTVAKHDDCSDARNHVGLVVAGERLFGEPMRATECRLWLLGLRDSCGEWGMDEDREAAKAKARLRQWALRQAKPLEIREEAPRGH